MTDYGPWARVIVHHAKDAFASQDKIAREWQALNFTAAPDYGKAVAQFDAFVEVLSRADVIACEDTRVTGHLIRALGLATRAKLLRYDEHVAESVGASLLDRIAAGASVALGWAARQEGAGSQRFLREIIAEHRLDPADRRTTARAYSERDAAAAIATGQADVAPGVRAAAGEFGLEFLPIGWEAFDLAMSRGIFFRTLLRSLLDVLRGAECQRLAQVYVGYDFAELGEIVWTA